MLRTQCLSSVLIVDISSWYSALFWYPFVLSSLGGEGGVEGHSVVNSVVIVPSGNAVLDLARSARLTRGERALCSEALFEKILKIHKTHNSHLLNRIVPRIFHAS